MIGWILVAGFIGAITATCLVIFWDNIRSWLNNVAADAVEKAIGYNARKKMHRAVVKVDRIMDRIRNKTIVYTKKSTYDLYYDKTVLSAESCVNEIDEDVIRKINEDKLLFQEFEYRS